MHCTHTLSFVFLFTLPCSTLKTLAFSNQSLSGTLPPAWGQSSTGTRRLQASSDGGAFPALRELLLSYNDLTGALATESAPSVATVHA